MLIEGLMIGQNAESDVQEFAHNGAARLFGACLVSVACGSRSLDLQLNSQLTSF
jgi:hypothetical protein